LASESNQLLEHTWTPVRLSGSNGSYSHATSTASGASMSANPSWYSKYITMDDGQGRRSILQQRDNMDRQSIEISRALDIMAEDLSSCNADDEDIFQQHFDEDTHVQKTMVKVLRQMLDVWDERTKMTHEIYDHAREFFKYGGVYFLKRKDGSLKKLRQEQLIGYILSDEDDTVVTHYLVDWDAPYLDLVENFKKVETYTTNNQNREVARVPVSDMLVIKRGCPPFGESILDRAYPIFRKLQLLEDGVVIHRVVRSPMRRVFKIDVGRLPPKKHKEVIDKYRLQMKQRQVLNKNGDVSSDFDPHSATEDFYLPVTSQGRSSSIETLQGGSDSGDLSDLTYFARKLAAAMRIPPSMTDTQNERNDQNQYSDMRVGQVYQIEVRYLGFINRDKRGFEKVLRDNFEEFCHDRDVTVPDEMEFKMNEAHNFALYREMEVNQQLLNMAGNAVNQFDNMSKRYAYSKYLNMSEEDLHDNETMVLKEKGLTEDQIKQMPEEAVRNVVYGDGRLGEKYGLPANEDDGMGF